jgi:hypothetical protein
MRDSKAEEVSCLLNDGDGGVVTLSLVESAIVVIQLHYEGVEN